MSLLINFRLSLPLFCVRAGTVTMTTSGSFSDVNISGRTDMWRSMPESVSPDGDDFYKHAKSGAKRFFFFSWGDYLAEVGCAVLFFSPTSVPTIALFAS